MTWVPEQLQWRRCLQHQPLRKVACSSVFLKRDPLVFPSCFIDESHLVEPGGEQPRGQPKKGSKPRFPHGGSLPPGASDRGAWLQAKCFSRTHLESLLCPWLRPSRREELGRALAIAVLGYGVPVGVLVLHALG